jgi:hypothetical protein
MPAIHADLRAKRPHCSPVTPHEQLQRRRRTRRRSGAAPEAPPPWGPTGPTLASGGPGGGVSGGLPALAPARPCRRRRSARAVSSAGHRAAGPSPLRLRAPPSQARCRRCQWPDRSASKWGRGGLGHSLGGPGGGGGGSREGGPWPPGAWAGGGRMGNLGRLGLEGQRNAAAEACPALPRALHCGGTAAARGGTTANTPRRRRRRRVAARAGPAVTREPGPKRVTSLQPGCPGPPPAARPPGRAARRCRRRSGRRRRRFKTPRRRLWRQCGRPPAESRLPSSVPWGRLPGEGGSEVGTEAALRRTALGAAACQQEVARNSQAEPTRALTQLARSTPPPKRSHPSQRGDSRDTTT